MKAVRTYTKRGRIAEQTLQPEASILDRLHVEFLEHPPTPKQVGAAISGYIKARAEHAKAVAEVKARQDIATRLGAEMKQLKDKASRNHQAFMKAVSARTARQKIVTDFVEDLLKTHGRVPIQIDGVTYDFGCSGERVYLVPRRPSKAKGKKP